MICDICRDRPAVIFVQQVTKNSNIELHLCEECARERGFSTTENKIDISLGGLFSNILDEGAGTRPRVCPACGFSFADIRKLRKAGCADCYRQFRGEIVSLLRSDGVEIGYTGPLPGKLEPFAGPRDDEDQLRRELRKAIEREDYERAAYFRDRIRAIGEKK